VQKKGRFSIRHLNPRVLLGFYSLLSWRTLAMFSLAATPPVETTHVNTSVPQPAASESMPLVQGRKE